MKDVIHTDIHGKEKSKIDYTAVVIEGEEEINFESIVFRILEKFNVTIPEGWKKPHTYHMTITKGELSLGSKMFGAVGTRVNLTVHSLGVSDKAIAVGVRGLYSRNEIQHITIAFKDKPMDSNKIEDWMEFDPFQTFGYIREIESKDGFGRLKQIDV
jgi:hypothetical protein